MQIKRDKPRKINFTPGINPYAHGSVIAEFGNTRVHVTASVERSVPPFLKGKGSGWVTAEYSMLPASTHTRIKRERKGGVSGRGHEIQRLIGRSLRAIIDLKQLGERTITVDCDVLVADGGTRTAAISAGFIALKLAINKLIKDGDITKDPILDGLAAISVGIDKDNEIIADLNYVEDSTCIADFNIVMTESGKYVEVQGTAEGEPFDREQLDGLLECARLAINEVIREQKSCMNLF